MNKNEHLNEVLVTHSQSHIAEELKAYRAMRDEIRDKLNGEFGSKLYDLYNSGSYKKNTDINSRFDLDILVPFKRNAFPTLEIMYNAVKEFMEEAYKDNHQAFVKDQRVSIGFEITKNNKLLEFDLVPGRELSLDAYPLTHDLNLHYRFDDQDYLKTNVVKQVGAIKEAADANPELRSIIRLLKVWKANHNEPIKSFLIELLTIKAFELEANDTNKGLWSRLKMTLEYIRDHIETVKLVDPGKEGNIVTDTLETSEKIQIARRVRNILNQIEQNEAHLDYYFPVNTAFQDSPTQRQVGAASMGTNSFG